MLYPCHSELPNQLLHYFLISFTFVHSTVIMNLQLKEDLATSEHIQDDK